MAALGLFVFPRRFSTLTVGWETRWENPSVGSTRVSKRGWTPELASIPL